MCRISIILLLWLIGLLLLLSLLLISSEMNVNEFRPGLLH